MKYAQEFPMKQENYECCPGNQYTKFKKAGVVDHLEGFSVVTPSGFDGEVG